MDESALVRELHDEGRYKEALVVAKRVLRLVPGHADTLLCVSSCHSVLGHRRRALRYAQRAVAAAPFDVGIRVWLAEVYARRPDPRRALRAMNEALGLDPEKLTTHRAHVALLLHLRRYAQAAQAARDALRIDPRDPGLLDNLAQALTRLGRREEAAAVMRSALSDDPEHQPAHARLGWIELTGGTHAEAVLHFREALRLDPHDERARNGLLDALRSSTFLYRWPLRLVFWVTSRPPWLTLCLIAAGAGPLWLLSAAAEGTSLETPAALAPWIWGIALVSGDKLVQPFVDVLLRFDSRVVRHMMRRDVLRADLIVSLILIFVSPQLPIPDAAQASLFFATFLAAPVWHVVTWPERSGRRELRAVAAAALLVPAACLGASLLAFPSLAPWMVALLFLAWGIFFLKADRLARREGI